MTTALQTEAAPTPVARPPRARATPQILALSRVEAVRLIRHPLLLLGVGLSALLCVSVAGTDGPGQVAVLEGMGALPLAGGTLLAADLAGLRSHRDATTELYDALPAPARIRIAAQLLALAGPTALAALLTAVTYLLVGAGDLVVNEQGLRHVPALSELVQGPLMVAACGAAGALLATRARSAIIAPVVLLALLAVEVPLAVWGSPVAVRWALPFVNAAQVVPDSWVPCAPGDMTPHCSFVTGYDTAGMAVHALYLIVVTAAAAGAALRSRSGE